MTEKKEKKAKKIETEEDRIAKARKRRIALAKEKEPQLEKSNSREDWRKYFLKISSRMGLEKYLEEVIWSHLKATGNDKKELFEKGLKHFGFKI